MLQVLKVGGTVSGKLRPAHIPRSSSIGWFAGESTSPSGIWRSATLMMGIISVSSFTNSWALICVFTANEIAKLLNVITSLKFSSFVNMILSGSGSLGTMIGGDGSRASTAKRTGGVFSDVDEDDLPRNDNMDFLAGASHPGMVKNSWRRFAKVSRVEGGGRGGSMGRKTKGSIERRFVLKRLGLLTVTLRKYRMMAWSPGIPLKLGGKVPLTWFSESRA